MYIIIGTKSCSICDGASNFLEEHNRDYKKLNIDELEPIKKLTWTKFLNEEIGTNSVPQVFYYVGGFQELKQRVFTEEYQ